MCNSCSSIPKNYFQFAYTCFAIVMNIQMPGNLYILLDSPSKINSCTNARLFRNQAVMVSIITQQTGLHGNLGEGETPHGPFPHYSQRSFIIDGGNRAGLRKKYLTIDPSKGVRCRVLYSRTSGCRLYTQTLKINSSGHLNFFCEKTHGPFPHFTQRSFIIDAETVLGSGKKI